MTRKEIVGQNIRNLRNARGMSQTDLAQAIKRGQSTVAMYENGDRLPSTPIITCMAGIFGVSFDEVYYSEEERASGKHAQSTVTFDNSKINIPVPPYRGGFADSLAALVFEESELPANVRPISALHHQRVPMIGEVAAGEPIYAPEDVGVYVDAPVKCDAAITIKGDSMAPNYLEGDVVYIKCVPDVHEGAVAVVFLDDEATLKHVYKRPTGLTLVSDNMATHPPIMVEFEDYANVRIFGVPVGFTRMFASSIQAAVHKGFKK